jgi:hypothetical protein
MTRKGRGPADDISRTAEEADPRTARTPAARPDERGTQEEQADRIAETVPERTTRSTDRPHGTTADDPDYMDQGREGR